jgi:hypothetical protein
MITAAYIASSADQLDLELRIMRHFLLHPEAKEARDAFIASEMKERTEAMKQVLSEKGDRDELDNLVAQAELEGQQLWLHNNLHHLKEFSENRLNQMELILRYTLFEGFLQKIVGNILWEYPNLRQCPVHASLELKPGHKNRYKLLAHELRGHTDGERIAWTIAMVEAVDHLPFDRWRDEGTRFDRIYLRTYVSDVLGLGISRDDLWTKLEGLRKTRNHIVHRSLELLVSRTVVQDTRGYLGAFPTILVQKAARQYPKACAEEDSTEGDDGTPAYIHLQDYY